MDASNIPLIFLFVILTIWQLFWKGVALWQSARLKQKKWFIALFILIPLQDLGLLELVYLFRLANKQLTLPEVKSWFRTPKF